jgi:hypothetical protein
MSFNDDTGETGQERVSQMTYLREQAAATPAEFRFIASHYHPDNLDRKRGDIPESWRSELISALHGTWEMVCTLCLGHKYANQQLKQWLSDGRDYWLSGHTHRPTMMRPPQGKVHVGGVLELLTDASFRSVNVGSTTDYRAHVAVIEAFRAPDAKNDDHVKKVDDYVQFREIPLFDSEMPRERKRFELVMNAIGTYGREHRDIEHCVPYQSDRQSGFSLLGLNRDYQDDAWTVDCADMSRERLQRFISMLVSDHPDLPRSDVVRCLAFIASACEAGACNSGSDFDLRKCEVR